MNKDFETILDDPKTKKLVDSIYRTNNIVPKRKDVFRAFELCPLSKVRVVILGQDPYYQPGVADGLAFSTKLKKTPASLKNIFKELENEYNGIEFKSNDLTSWSKQGILLLNTSLTTVLNRPNSHKKHWNKFTREMINFICEERENVIFLLWGNNALSYSELIDSKKHFILESTHPSPLSANKGFFGNNHFRKVNEILRKLEKREIDWSIKD